MVAGPCYTCITLVMFVLAFRHNLTLVESSSNEEQNSLTQKDICHDTQQTVQQVTTCPENEKSYLQRSKSKQCDNYPPCMGKPLVYHCIRYEGDLVEVCSPRTKITGGFCAKFDKSVGRVVEDLSLTCSECPNNYDSDDYSKCVITTKKKSTFQTPIRQTADSSTTLHKLDKASTEDAYCDEQSCPNEPIKTSTEISDQGQVDKYDTTYFFVFTLVFVICLVGIMCYRRNKRTDQTLSIKEQMSDKEDTPLLQQKENQSNDQILNIKEQKTDKEVRPVQQKENCNSLDYNGSTGTKASLNSNGNKNDRTEEDLRTPGKPKPLKVSSDSVEIAWTKSDTKVDYYQVRYKSTSGQEKWKLAETDADQNRITINGLMAKKEYKFQVRGVLNDQEGSYGPQSDVINTTESLATALLGFSKLVAKGNPSKYQLLAEELDKSRNPIAKTRKLILGNPTQGSAMEKTIMLVGATGSGKSTLVDGMVNYVMGVSFDDPFRFTIVQLEEEEKKTHNQAVSQTEWITVYKIFPQKGSRLNYTLNIIDTPGFGDTRGIQRDQVTIDQIRHLFSEKGEKGVLFIDAVCFIVKAPEARLTVSQKYIFSSIMSLFGKDIESNICTLITFADGAEPPVLSSLKEANLPFGSTFQFNNSALYAENKKKTSSLSPMFWDMGCKSFQDFFDKLHKFDTRSLSQTKDVLQEREQLKTIIVSILPEVKAGLSKLSELRNQLEIFKKHRDDIENNKDFEYEAEETKQILVDLPPGQHVTNCLHCHYTCHNNCAFADDEQKINCCVMNNGFCTVCDEKCSWTKHKNTPFRYSFSVEKVKKTYTNMKAKYEEANGLKLTHETYIEELTNDVDYLFENIKLKMAQMKRCKARLEEIALRPDPLSAVEHIEMLIQAEYNEMQPGYLQRVQMLEEFKQLALVDTQIETFDKHFESTIDDVTVTVCKTNEIETNPKQGAVKRGIGYIKSFFKTSKPPSNQTKDTAMVMVPNPK